jgi:hypothetical protein
MLGRLPLAEIHNGDELSESITCILQPAVPTAHIQQEGIQ